MNIMNFFSRKRKYYFIASVRDAKQEVDDIISGNSHFTLKGGVYLTNIFV